MAVGRMAKNDSLISFNLDFIDEQKLARKVCHENVLTILTGKPGTSKTFIAASVALELILRKPKSTNEDSRYHGLYKEIIISRPTVEAGQKMGYLPGGLDEKLNPYIEPVYDVIRDLVGQETLKGLIDHGKIKTIPIQFLRGKTFKNCVVIIDESQNTDLKQLELISSRIGFDCKVIMTSDWRQVDLYDRDKSASKWLPYIQDLDDVGTFELKHNFRHKLAQDIMEVLQKVKKDEKI